jgi:hypothetical protein
MSPYVGLLQLPMLFLISVQYLTIVEEVVSGGDALELYSAGA